MLQINLIIFQRIHNCVSPAVLDWIGLGARIVSQNSVRSEKNLIENVIGVKSEKNVICVKSEKNVIGEGRGNAVIVRL